MFFQHDGAPPHYTNRVRELLHEIFPNRLCSPRLHEGKSNIKILYSNYFYCTV